jgi:hypothetical protein
LFTVNEFIDFTVLFHVIQLFIGPTTPFGAVHGPFSLAKRAITPLAGALSFNAPASTGTLLTATGIEQNKENQGKGDNKRDHY